MKINVQQLASHINHCKSEKVAFFLNVEPMRLYDEKAAPDFLVDGFSYSIRLAKGKPMERTLEVVGRSTASLEEAFENAFAQLFEAGQLSARLEPAAQDEEIPF